MSKSEALKILISHNEWRRYNRFSIDKDAPPMQHPKEIGEAIDVAIEVLKNEN